MCIEEVNANVVTTIVVDFLLGEQRYLISPQLLTHL